MGNVGENNTDSRTLYEVCRRKPAQLQSSCNTLGASQNHNRSPGRPAIESRPPGFCSKCQKQTKQTNKKQNRKSTNTTNTHRLIQRVKIGCGRLRTTNLPLRAPSQRQHQHQLQHLHPCQTQRFCASSRGVCSLVCPNKAHSLAARVSGLAGILPPPRGNY